MNTVITGASGFVGRYLVKTLKAQQPSSKLVLVDQHFPEDCADLEGPAIEQVSGDIHDPALVEHLFTDKVDTLYHLAALPGGASETDPALSKKVNLDATLALFDAASKSKCRRVVYSSSIAVLGSSYANSVDDTAPLQPSMTYGSHKAMVELALADMARRGVLDIVGLRFPGILARPAAPSGLKSAFLSNIFHSLKAHEPFVSPVSKDATFWLMSAQKCVDNLITAAHADSSLFPESRVMTYPAVYCSMEQLVDSILEQTGADKSLISYEIDTQLEEIFGSFPELSTPAAERAGLSADASLDELVKAALSSL